MNDLPVLWRGREAAASSVFAGTPDESLDALGLLCPAPIIKTAKRMKTLPAGAVLEVLSDDRGIEADMPAWCRSHGQEYLGFKKEGTVYRVFVRKVK